MAGFGTTFAAVPDLIAMFRRRSSAGMNPRMAAIIGVFQILWVYYGLLIHSRPVVAWNLIGVFINLLGVSEYRHFARKEKLNLSSGPPNQQRKSARCPEPNAHCGFSLVSERMPHNCCCKGKLAAWRSIKSLGQGGSKAVSSPATQPPSIQGA